MNFVVSVRPGQPWPFLAGLFGCCPALLAIFVCPTNSISGVAVSASIIVLLHRCPVLWRIRCSVAFRPCHFSRFASLWPFPLSLFVPMRSSLSSCLVPVWLCLFFFRFDRVLSVRFNSVFMLGASGCVFLALFTFLAVDVWSASVSHSQSSSALRC